jgi:MFS family permease
MSSSLISLRPVRFIRDEYVIAYRGLPRRAWILFAVNLVNASGSMVIFFLALYLTRKIGLTAARAGQALSLYGLGSLAGAFAGGWFSDRVGSIRVQKLSLVACGAGLIVLGQVTAIGWILPLLFAFGLFAGMLYPANATSMAAICPPELQVKGFALTRLANNLGATIGPAVGGVLALRDYRLLFWADGATSLAAAAVFAALWAGGRAASRVSASASAKVAAAAVGEGGAPDVAGDATAATVGDIATDNGDVAGIAARIIRAPDMEEGRSGQPDPEGKDAGSAWPSVPGSGSRSRSLSPWRDVPFLLMMLIFLVWSVVFIQLLTTFPLYMRNVYGLAENRIGQLFAVNTIMIVALEMILMEKIRKYPLALMINVSFVLLGVGLGLMPLGRGFAFGAMTVAVWTFGEMLSMPLVSALIAERSDETNRGRYMGLSSFSFSLAFIIAPAVGMAIYGRLGPDAVWYICCGVCFLLAVAFSLLRPYLNGVGPQKSI